MEGRGAYNRSSRVQAAGLLPALSLFEQAAKAVPLAEGPEPIVIADYGASEGRNSLIPIGLAISSLRERVGPERAISVVHADLPTSDFNGPFEPVFWSTPNGLDVAPDGLNPVSARNSVKSFAFAARRSALGLRTESSENT